MIFTRTRILLLFASIFLSAQFNSAKAQSTRKTNGAENSVKSAAVRYSKFNINNISTFILNNGIADASPSPDSYSGFQFPKGSGKICVTNTGFLWAGKIEGLIYSGGSSFYSGLTPGKILANGSAEDPNASGVRVYRVRRDFKESDLTKEALDEIKSVQEIFDQYQKDWNEWPADNGAPFEDKNMDGKYNPQIDIPGVPGADQTLWFVANDLDSTKTKGLFGSSPMGIEVQVSVWGYNMTNPIGDALSKRYVIINKSEKHFDDMHVGIWSDVDISARRSDFAGCDTALNLGYIFSSIADDDQYHLSPPAVGFSLLQGPVVPGTVSDQALFLGKKIKGKKNLGLSAFAYTTNSNVPYIDPKLGQYRGTTELYNLLQGKVLTGEPWPVPPQLGGWTTKFPLSGDYLRRTGFYDGVQLFASDRRMLLSSGSFNMAPGDTQEVVFAEIAAGADGLTNNFAAVALLKTNTFFLRNSYLGSATTIVNKTRPEVIVTEMDGEILLDWGENQNQIRKIENEDYFYKFEGYNVYQFLEAGSKFSEAKLVATYDLRNGVTKVGTIDFDPLAQSFVFTVRLNGSDSGIKRHISIKNDLLRNKPLVNWNEYYFGVTQYSYSNSNLLSTNYSESEPVIYKAVPRPFKPGFINTLKAGTEIPDFHQAGTSTASLYLNVINPLLLTNSEFEISFRLIQNVPFFNVKNITTGKIILSDQSIPDSKDDIPLIEGVLLRIFQGTTRPLSDKDVYWYKTTGYQSDQNSAEENLNNINVFPNPYYGSARNEIFNYDRFVTFTHLPHRAVFRIFNLAGQLVKKIEKDSPEQFIKWDLISDGGMPLSSGIYIVHIELSEFGKIKILKLAVILAEYNP